MLLVLAIFVNALKRHCQKNASKGKKCSEGPIQHSLAVRNHVKILARPCSLFRDNTAQAASSRLPRSFMSTIGAKDIDHHCESQSRRVGPARLDAAPDPSLRGKRWLAIWMHAARERPSGTGLESSGWMCCSIV